MARYRTTIASRLPEQACFAYMADFSNARLWDPSVSEARRLDEGSLALGSAFELVARFAGRELALRYTIVGFEPPLRVVLEAQRPGFVSRDTITVEASASGSSVHYDALLALAGVRRLLEPLMQRLLDGVGERASAGLRAALNP